MESHSRTNPEEFVNESVSSKNSKSDAGIVGEKMFSARDYAVFDTSEDSSKTSTIRQDIFSSSTVASSEDLIVFHDSHVQLQRSPILKDGDESLSQNSNLTHESLYLTPTRSPPSIQVMERSDGYNPTRIPASVFSSNPKSPVEWSITSNESLFSIHVGRIASFSGDHFTKMGRDELTKSAELIAYGSAPHVKTMEVDGKCDGKVKSVEPLGEADVLIKNADYIVPRPVPIKKKKKKSGWSCCSCSSCRWTFCSCKWPFGHCCNRIWAFCSCKWPRCSCTSCPFRLCSSCSWKCCSLKYCSCKFPSCCSSCSCPKCSSCSCPSCSSCACPSCSSCSCPSCSSCACPSCSSCSCPNCSSCACPSCSSCSCPNCSSCACPSCSSCASPFRCCSSCSWNCCSCPRPRCCCKWPTFDCSHVFSNCWHCTGKKNTNQHKQKSKCNCFSCCSRPCC